MKFQVSGMICITPRAPALETAALLNALSFEAIDCTNGGDIPYWAASSSTLSPSSAAIDHRLSPGSTAWETRPSAVIGLAAMSSAMAERMQDVRNNTSPPRIETCDSFGRLGPGPPRGYRLQRPLRVCAT